MLERLKSRGFDILALHHAEAIISHDMPEADVHLKFNHRHYPMILTTVTLRPS